MLLQCNRKCLKFPLASTDLGTWRHSYCLNQGLICIIFSWRVLMAFAGRGHIYSISLLVNEEKTRPGCLMGCLLEDYWKNPLIAKETVPEQAGEHGGSLTNQGAPGDRLLKRRQIGVHDDMYVWLRVCLCTCVCFRPPVSVDVWCRFRLTVMAIWSTCHSLQASDFELHSHPFGGMARMGAFLCRQLNL